MEMMVLSPFGAGGVVISDKATSFTARVLWDFMAQHGMQWKTVLAYAPISDGGAESMVGTIKKSIGRIVNDFEKEWDTAVDRVVFGYCRCPGPSGPSLVKLLYGIKPRIIPSYLLNSARPSTASYLQIELLTFMALRTLRHLKQVENERKGK